MDLKMDFKMQDCKMDMVKDAMMDLPLKLITKENI